MIFETNVSANLFIFLLLSLFHFSIRAMDETRTVVCVLRCDLVGVYMPCILLAFQLIVVVHGSGVRCRVRYLRGMSVGRCFPFVELSSDVSITKTRLIWPVQVLIF